MNRRRLERLGWVLGALLTMSVGGCASGGHREAEAAAFRAGQEQAFQMLEQNGISVVRMIGPFNRQVLRWHSGMTVAEAIVEGGYMQPGAPSRIFLRRGVRAIPVNPEALLAGKDVELESGDILEVLP